MHVAAANEAGQSRPAKLEALPVLVARYGRFETSVCIVA